MVAAHRTIGIAAKLQFTKAHVQGIVKQKPAFQGVALTENDLHGLRCLYDTDQSGKNAQHSAFSAARHETRGRRFGVKAPVARTIFIREDRSLSFEAKDGTI